MFGSSHSMLKSTNLKNFSIHTFRSILFQIFIFHLVFRQNITQFCCYFKFNNNNNNPSLKFIWLRVCVSFCETTKNQNSSVFSNINMEMSVWSSFSLPFLLFTVIIDFWISFETYSDIVLYFIFFFNGIILKKHKSSIIMELKI